MRTQTKTQISTRTKIIVAVLAVGAAAAAAAFGGGGGRLPGGDGKSDGKSGEPSYQSFNYTSPGYKSGPYVTPTAGMLIRTRANPAVYYYNKSGNRYVFPNEKTLDSWYAPKKPTINLVKDEVMATIPLKGTVTYRPGARLLKLTSDPKVYAVDKGGVLRWESSEEVLKKTYGINWVKRVDDLPDPLVGTYKFGPDIVLVSDYSSGDLFKIIKTVEDDLLYK